jgi:membrane protein YdbS with pleckstrin-like domain
MSAEIFQGRLLAGEHIVWSGRPSQGVVFTSRDIFLVPFSLLWCGFAIFWTFGATFAIGAPSFFTLWGLMFVCVGLYFVVGRFIVDAWFRTDLRYAVTDQRILIARPAPFARFTVISLSRLPNVDLVEGASGRGTIRFGEVQSMWGNRSVSSWSPAFDPTPQFIAIDDARKVFDLVQRSGARP